MGKLIEKKYKNSFEMKGKHMQEIDISAVGKKVINTIDLYEALRRLGIRRGDVICVHSHLMSFGKPLLERQDFMKAIIEVLFKTIGEEGTLIMPTFSYSFCKNEEFNIEKTPSDVGVLTEYFRTMDNVKRTWHPIFSFAIFGAKTKEYLDIGPDAFGLDSIYGKMISDKGKLVMLGANKGYTFYHLAEEHVHVSHRYFKEFVGDIVTSAKKYKASVPYFVRYLDRDSVLDENKLSKFLIGTGCQKQIKFAKGTIAVVDCEKAYLETCDALLMDEGRFLIST